MSTRSDPLELFAPIPVGEPRPVHVIHSGLQYRGEVVVLDEWDAEWGRSLSGSSYFRVVVLRRRKRVPTDDIRDSRIAVCVPARGSPKHLGRQLDRDLSTIRETQTLYATRRESEDTFISSYLHRQGKDIEERLVSEAAERYAGGRIKSPAAFEDDIDWYFSGGEPMTWFERIGATLLSWSYPTLPLEPKLLPRNLTPTEVPDIFNAIFAATTGKSSPLEEFGPALGLSTTDYPATFDPTDCSVFQVLREKLKADGELPWSRIHAALAHGSGLTRPLATLFLLAFVHHGRPETVLRLIPGHRLELRDGRPVRGTTVAGEFVRHLPWIYDAGVEDAPVSSRVSAISFPPQEVIWNDALQYTSLLCQGLTEVEEGAQAPPDQGRELSQALEALVALVAASSDILEAALGPVSVEDVEQLEHALHCLRALSEAGDFQTVYNRARAHYTEPDELLRGWDKMSRLLDLGEILDEVQQANEYLEHVQVDPVFPELAVDRAALMEQVAVPVVLSSPQIWPAVRAHLTEFQTRYGRAYAAHHALYQQEGSRLRDSIESLRTNLGALELLNSVTELGNPAGEGLASQIEQLAAQIKCCDRDSQLIEFHAAARCAGCQMALGEIPPSTELAALSREVERALGEQNRRLSRCLVDKIIHGGEDKRMDSFLRAVQASDLSALSNTLDHELAAFIRRLLASP